MTVLDRLCSWNLIITNADIWVVDYEKNETVSKRYKWVVHKVKTTNALSLEPKPQKEEIVTTFSVPIVNVEYINELIPAINSLNISTRNIIIPVGEVA